LLIGKAAGIPSKKLLFGNRSHNQGVMHFRTRKCFVTSQNHGYALDDSKLPDGWEILYTNIHDGSNEGIAHKTKPFKSVQFHPEAKGGPLDTMSFFEDFIAYIEKYRKSH
jgi:carbamoyl-phosphate synthase small subunit